MELRQYWNVIWRRRWLVLVIVAAVIILSAYMLLTAKRSYQGTLRFIVRQEAEVTRPNYVIFTFDRYYNWFSSEFLVDDYTQIATSDAFANSVLATVQQDRAAGKLNYWNVQKLSAEVDSLSAARIKSGIESDRKQRELRVVVSSTSKELTKAIADAAAAVLTDAKLKPISGNYDMGADKAAFSLIDGVSLDTISSSTSREILYAIVRVLIGVVVALALAFLLEYLDRSLRDESDAERVLGLPVLGAIPRS